MSTILPIQVLQLANPLPIPGASPSSSAPTSSDSAPSHSSGLDPGAIAGIVSAVLAFVAILVAMFVGFPAQVLRWITYGRYPCDRVRTADGGSRPPNNYEMRGRILHRRRPESQWLEA